ncbi:hypothetical protein [Flavobacterium sp. MMS24-S5]|uniref:hypothetical protein n=1 Tax=Flavobacterium sp. MMS24-S5 TaxID=3416605 RepID=UPI003CFD2F9D
MKKIYFAVFTVICTNFYAQTKNDSINQMDEVIINEGRFNTPISKQNRNVYVISSETIKKLPGRTLQEVLQYANGVDIRQRDHLELKPTLVLTVEVLSKLLFC